MPRRSTARSRRCATASSAHDARRIEDIWQVAYRGGFYRGGPVLMSALAGLEQALWDLKGKAVGLPAWEMLGGRVRDRIRAYAWIGGDRPHEIARRGRHAQATGLLRGQDERHRRARLDRHAQAVRRGGRSGSKPRRRWAWTSGSISTAASTGRWPSSWPRCSSRSACCSSRSRCCPRIPRGCARSRTWSSTPIALGERLYSRWDFKPILRAGRGRHHPAGPQPRRRHSRGAGRSRRWPRPTTSRSRRIARSGPLALASCLQLAGLRPQCRDPGDEPRHPLQRRRATC